MSRAPRLAGVALVLAGLSLSGASEPLVKVASMDSVGPRPVEAQTRSSVVRDYLQAWKSLDIALGANRSSALDTYFVGISRDKLADTVRDQQNLGIHTHYRERSHDIQVVFYSPEGLSIQLLDNVAYDVEVDDGRNPVGTHHVRTRYVVVLTPAESKWKIRMFQAAN